jgi:outer membrane lipase/esterase
MGQTIPRIAVAAAVAAVALSGPAAGQTLNQFIGFGDSTIDSGWYRTPGFPPIGGANFNAAFPTAVAQGAGAPTSRPGLMSSEVLAAYFGLTAIPGNQTGGTNFATGGARNSLTNGPGDGLFQGAVPTVTQINRYLAGNGGFANSSALFLISSGGNDIGFAIDNLAVGARNAYVTQAGNDLVAGIARLSAAGARYIIVPNTPESFGNVTQMSLRTLYDNTVWGGLAAAGVNFIPADINSVRLAIAANPAAFGFQFIGTGSPACQQPAGITSAWALLCATSVSPLVAPNADLTHLFADDQHLATAGQKIFGDYFYNLVVAPSQISLLAENPIKTRADVITAIENQIPASQRVRGPQGFNSWVSGDVSSLKIDNSVGFRGEGGTPLMVTAGLDVVAPTGTLVGFAVSAGTKNPRFDTYGSYTQDEIAVSGYAAQTLGRFWFSAIGSAGALSYDVNRVAPLGITLQQNTGSTNGDNVSFALKAGGNLINGPITHGPIAGVTLQRVHVDGFTEVGGVTSLAFADQSRNSVVSVLGYQASADLGFFRPFARVLWNHEFESGRLVTASLTTTVAPSYSLPAVELGRDWASATIGTMLILGTNVTGSLAFTGQIGQDQVTAYGGQVGLNVAF